MARAARLILVALALAAVTCTKGKECDTCETDSDCKDKSVCVNFKDDSGNVVGKRCGSGQGATTCRVR
jgi:hypothetical protein